MLVELVTENKADIVVLAEYELDLQRVCDLLAIDGCSYKEARPINSGCRVKLLLKEELSYEYYKDPKYYFIVKITNVVGYEFLLGWWLSKSGQVAQKEPEYSEYLLTLLLFC